MAPGPIHQQQKHSQSSDSNTSTTLLELQNPPLPTQEEAQVCTRMMSTLLEYRLQEALAAESISVPPVQIYFQEVDKNSEFVTCYDRDRMVRWLCILTHDFHYCLEVFFRASSILDSFLSLMKVRPKFLQCVAASCFFVASKLEEKPESVDTVLSAMVQNYSCQFTSKDIHRMDLIIMQKLDFKLNNHTPYDFLKIFHIVGITNGSLSLPPGLSPDQHVCHTALCMEEIVSNHVFMKFRPSLLALAVLGCDLKLLGCDWLTAVVTLQKLAGVKGGELSVCYEAVAPFYNMVARQHPLYVCPKMPPPPPQAASGGKEERAEPGDGPPGCEVVQEGIVQEEGTASECGGEGTRNGSLATLALGTGTQEKKEEESNTEGLYEGKEEYTGKEGGTGKEGLYAGKVTEKEGGTGKEGLYAGKEEEEEGGTGKDGLNAGKEELRAEEEEGLCTIEGKPATASTKKAIT